MDSTFLFGTLLRVGLYMLCPGSMATGVECGVKLEEKRRKIVEFANRIFTIAFEQDIVALMSLPFGPCLLT